MDLTSSVATVERWIAVMTPFINKVVVVIILLLMGFIAGKIVGRLFLWALRSIKSDEFLRRAFKVQWAFSRTTSHVISILIYAVTLYAVLHALGIVALVAGVILVIALILAVASLLVGMKDFFLNAFAGFSVRGRIHRGDAVETERFSGVVRRTGFLCTEIVMGNGDAVLVPHIALAGKKKMPRHRGRG